MAKLEYRFTNDALFRSLFTKHQGLLKELVAEMLGISLESIEQFGITSSDIPPDKLGEKFCHLDITMVLDGQRVNLEIQVANEGNYPERSLYYWAREYSSALQEGMDYTELPRTVHISILAFKLFDCEGFHSEFQPLEVKRHEALTDKMSMHYFELPKVPEGINPDDRLKLWMSLFKAETEEELKLIEATGVPIMQQAIKAYREVTANSEFQEIERMRHRARHDEISALRHAAKQATAVADAKWQGALAKKDDALAKKDAEIAKLQAQLAEKK